MSDSGYTLTDAEVLLGYVMGQVIANQAGAVGDFQRWLSAHDAVIREDERQKAIDTIRFHRGGYNRNGSSHKLLLKMEDAILSQSFTGTESEQTNE